jgi:hypothetical protein
MSSFTYYSLSEQVLCHGAIPSKPWAFDSHMALISQPIRPALKLSRDRFREQKV